MMNNSPFLIEHKNISYAWAKLFLHLLDTSGKETSGLTISLTGFSNGILEEDLNIREALDSCLLSYEQQEVHTVANTIFPINLWRYSQDDRKILFENYSRNLSRIKALKPSKNCRGLYFERLINFNKGAEYSNQLEHIISAYNNNPSLRKAAFQASIFDPSRDHTTSAQLGFPCLQHLQFIPRKNEQTLSVNAFYATQKVFEKSYGNYLGICRLGNFMAHEMNLSMDRVNFFIGVAKIDSINKGDERIRKLKEVLNHSLTSV
jgi:thymidylate synthase